MANATDEGADPTQAGANTSSIVGTRSATSPVTFAATGFGEFGIQSVLGEESTVVAGARPDFTTRFVLNHHTKGGKVFADARVENISVSLPPGLIGNPTTIPYCKTAELAAFGNCPIDSQVGVSKVLLSEHAVGDEPTLPVYNLEPPHPGQEVARFGFFAAVAPVFIDVSVRTDGDYGVTATVHDSAGQASLLSATTSLWANPADPAHDEQRLTTAEAPSCQALGTACEAPGGKRSSGIEDPRAFLSNPSACQEQELGVSVTSYQLPGQVFSQSTPMASIEGCQGLPFEPAFEAEPTTHVAGAPTGLKTTLRLLQHEGPEERATATMREARVTLPEGMQIAAGAANGIEACSDEQVGFHQEVPASCPDASKLGTATFVSPDLAQPLHGAIYQRTPSPGHQFGLWLVTDELGLHIKLPGEILPNPNTGQLTAVFTDLPQVPVEEIDLDVWGGPRAPLKNPDSCGTYATAYSFAPHSQDPAASGQDQMTIDEGCSRGFAPKLQAGVTNPKAGAFSPFIFDLTREDSDQPLRGVEVHLPNGELAKLRGVTLCPDDVAGSGACPADSKIGQVTVASGPGPQPLWLPQPGKSPTAVYLAGPYQGAPYSIVTAVPAQAGPFDLGVVAVRSGLYVDPETAQATVKADPLPQFIEGVATAYRRIHVVIDRPEFSLNPTNCSELAVRATPTSTSGTVAQSSDRFQVGGCKQLKFAPKLSLRLKGGTKRGDYPALSATLKARKHDANIARTVVALPHSEFLAQEHIGTICTRVQFAARKCPKRSVYGFAKAWTPLLSKPLEGPVYLRSSDHPLPDLVAALGGQIEIDLVGRIDSHNGGIRTTFASVPDAPVTKFVLRMKGGKKGLLVNSTDICQRARRAQVQMGAQNGRRIDVRPALGVTCPKR